MPPSVSMCLPCAQACDRYVCLPSTLWLARAEHAGQLRNCHRCKPGPDCTHQPPPERPHKNNFKRHHPTRPLPCNHLQVSNRLYAGPGKGLGILAPRLRQAVCWGVLQQGLQGRLGEGQVQAVRLGSSRSQLGNRLVARHTNRGPQLQLALHCAARSLFQ